MPGAFAHITLVSQVKDRAKGFLPKRANRAIGLWFKFCELGAVSPDYPYLVLGDKTASQWADRMHYIKTVDVIRNSIEMLKQLDGATQDKCLAWLMGYAAHVGMDVTIHPVVELKVGPYHGNETAHRECEMHQDVFIWEKLRPNLGRLGVCEHFDNGIANCSDELDLNALDGDVRSLWEYALQTTYANQFAATPPDINAWHKWFMRIVDAAEETRDISLFPLSRHILGGRGVMYPNTPDSQYIEGLRVPVGDDMHYQDIFEKAIDNVGQLWQAIARAVYEDDSSYFDDVGNWNLDTGKDLETKEFIFWK